MLCPRCHAEATWGALACPRCAAPLRLADEPPPAVLDRDLDLDRRLAPREEAAVAPALPPPEGGGEAARQEEPDISEGTLEIHLRSAPAWRRGVAAAVDAALLAAVAGGPLLLAARGLPAGADWMGPLLPPGAAFAALLGFAYGALGHALMGATLGKRLLGLRVAGPDGGSPGLARSAGRAALAVVGTAAFGVGPLVALFTRSGRSLHDLVADTVVVRAP